MSSSRSKLRRAKHILSKYGRRHREHSPDSELSSSDSSDSDHSRSVSPNGCTLCGSTHHNKAQCTRKEKLSKNRHNKRKRSVSSSPESRRSEKLQSSAMKSSASDLSNAPPRKRVTNSTFISHDILVPSSSNANKKKEFKLWNIVWEVWKTFKYSN